MNFKKYVLGDAISILDQDHLIKGVSVVTRSADPIQEQKSRPCLSANRSSYRFRDSTRNFYYY